MHDRPVSVLELYVVQYDEANLTKKASEPILSGAIGSWRFAATK
jgi:hypothetical protein